MAGDIKVQGFGGEEPQPGDPVKGTKQSGSGSGSGSGEAAVDKKKLNRYLDYLTQMGLTPDKLTNKIAREALQGGHSTSWFVTQVRTRDPRYTKTTDFKNRMSSLWQVWQSEMGANTPMPRKWALSKALSAMPMNAAAVTRAIRKMPQFKKAYKGINLDLMTPAEYRQWSAAYDQISKNVTGRALTPAEKFIMFSNNVAPGDYEKALVMTRQGQTAYNVTMGKPLTAAEEKTAVYGGAGQTGILSRIQAAGQMAQSLAQSRPAGYDLSRREEDRTLTMSGI